MPIFDIWFKNFIKADSSKCSTIISNNPKRHLLFSNQKSYMVKRKANISNCLTFIGFENCFWVVILIKIPYNSSCFNKCLTSFIFIVRINRVNSIMKIAYNTCYKPTNTSYCTSNPKNKR